MAATPGNDNDSGDEYEDDDDYHDYARTPSSENKSLASALSSGIEADMYTTGGEDEEEEEKVEEKLVEENNSQSQTPVGTLERQGGGYQLRRSFSRWENEL